VSAYTMETVLSIQLVSAKHLEVEYTATNF